MIQLVPEAKDSIISFIHNFWKKNHILVKDINLFDYMYLNNKTEYNFFYNSKKNDVKAIIGVIIPSDKNIWFSLWRSIGTDNEGFSLFTDVLKKFKPNFVGAIGINNKVEKFYKYLDWSIVTLNHYYVSKPEIKPIFSKNYRFVNKFDFNYKYNDSYSPEKNNSYLNNRYNNHPHFDYNYLEIPSEEIIFIGRTVKYLDQKVFHVVDFIGNLNQKNIKSVLHNFLFDNNFDMLEMMAYLSDSPVTDLSLKRDDTIIPLYFNPFENKNITVRCAYKTQSHSNVKIVLGDSDQDRPN